MNCDKGNIINNYSYKKWLALFMAMIMLSASVGCGAKENNMESVTEQSEMPVLESESSSSVVQGTSEEEPIGTSLEDTQEDLQESATVEEDAISGIQYGDTIQVSLTVQETSGVVEDLGESEIVVANTSKEFPWPWPDEWETDVEEAVGKYVGDTFFMWYEGGDGRFGYEFTILEIPDKQTDYVEYGDRIKVSCRRTSFMAESEVKENTYESIEIPVWTNQEYTRLGESETYEVETSELLRELMGKQIGDTVWIVEETMEMRRVYRMSILSVDKNPQDTFAGKMNFTE